jgi:hypothetical protein
MMATGEVIEEKPKLLQARMKTALVNLMKRFDIKDDTPPLPQDYNDVDKNHLFWSWRRGRSVCARPGDCSLVQGSRRMWRDGRRPISGRRVVVVSAAAHASTCAIVVAQASSAASERIWSAAGLMSSGNRASISPASLATQLLLKKNTPTRAVIEKNLIWSVLGQKKQ